ncbi:MAG: hypothetical protein AAF762_01275, partial [Pseudomonadota bacterium]
VALAEFFVSSFEEKKQSYILETHSDFLVDRIRLAIREGRIGKNDVSLLFFERGRLDNSVTEIALNESGEPESPPDAYREFFLDEQLRLLGIMNADSD